MGYIYRYSDRPHDHASIERLREVIGENIFKSWAKIVDCGDVAMTVLDNTVALKQLDKAHSVCQVSTSPKSWELTTRRLSLVIRRTLSRNIALPVFSRWVVIILPLSRLSDLPLNDGVPYLSFILIATLTPGTAKYLVCLSRSFESLL